MGRTSHDPEELLRQPLIPHWCLRRLDKKLERPSPKQVDAIRSILNYVTEQPFMRCRGKRWSFVKACEEKGDMSHSGKKHRCDLCRCRLKAGSGTKGDFYGLGPETGHLGVGFCWKCSRALTLRPGVELKMCRQQVKNLQIYGTVNMDTDYSLKVAQEEAALAVRSTEARAEVTLLANEIAHVRKELESGDAFEYVKGEKMDLSTKTRAMLIADLAKISSKLGLDGLKLDQDNYIHADELTRRMPEMMTLVFNCMSKLEEMLIAKHVRGEELETSKTPQDYVREIFRAEMQTIWASAKTGRRK